MGNFQTRRYIGGKRPEKYFVEDLNPKIEGTLLKLGIDEQRGLIIFQAFVAMDTDESETVDVEECFAFLGGAKTKFTERIIINIEGRYDAEKAKQGLDFLHFAIVLWDYCTLTSAGIARYIFEIFDVDHLKKLEKADVETMYRMLYDCDDHDEYYVSQFPFNPVDESISKKDFIEHARKKKHLIEPALNYQAKLRKKLGGYVMWQFLTAHRKRKFQVHDDESPLLTDAIQAILNSEEIVRKKNVVNADALLEDARKKHLAEEAALTKQLKEREFFLKMQKKKAALKPEDKVLQDAWDELEELKTNYTETKWHIDKMKKKIHARNDIYAVYDKCAGLYAMYWKAKEDKEIALVTGTEDDHRQRMRDYINTKRGSFVHKRTVLLKLFATLLKKYAGDGAKASKGSVTRRKGKQELAIEVALSNIESVIEKEKSLEDLMLVDPATAKAKMKHMEDAENKLTLQQAYADEWAVGKKFASAAQLEEATKEAEEELFNIIHSKTMKELDDSITNGREERRKFLVKKEFEIISNFGARETKWEQLYDKTNDKYIYLNSETLERKHIKTAVCEKCDGLFAQSDLKCPTCDAVRSAKNQKLYRPLGFGNITDD